jgi:PAS domain S-box-containing protein
MSGDSLLNGISNTEKSELRFQNFIRQAPVGMIVLMGEKLRVDVVNDFYGQLVGRTPEELQGKSVFDIIPDAEEHFKPIIDSVRLSGKPLYLYDYPYRVRNRDGGEKSGYLNLIYQPYRETDGCISGVMVLCHDVTEQVELRKRTQQAEEKLRLAIESGDLGTYEFDMRTGKITVSDRFREIWGVKNDLSREALVNKVHRDDQYMREQAHMQSLITGHLFYEARVMLSSNEYRWVRVNGRVLFDCNGKPTSLLGVVQDITNQKDYADRLNKLVQERIEELQTLNEELTTTNEELSEANVQLITANRDLEQFAYVASHDLQEPLRKLQTFSHLLLDRFSSELSEGAQIYIQKIRSSAARMSHLIKDILDYSRLAHNKPSFQEVDLNVVLSNVLSDYELMIMQKKITVEADELPAVEAIPIQMNQLFYNLVGNSVKFVRKGVNPLITIKCNRLTPEESEKIGRYKKERTYFRFVVSDNGIGFSQQYAEHIFSIFQQLNNKSKFGGYGIGLSLCKRIVENHDGVIYANGVENQGATFTFILPVKHH